MGNLVPLTQTPPPWIICYHAKLSPDSEHQ